MRSDTRGRKENGSELLQLCPLCGCNRIGGVTGTIAICAVQRIVAGIPVVGQQNHTVHVVHFGLGIADATRCTAGFEQIQPLLFGEGAPTTVLLVTAVADGIVAPVGLAGLVEQVVSGVAVGIVVARITRTCAPRLVAVGPVVISASAPAKQVAVHVLCITVLASGSSKIIPLVIGKLPIRCLGAAIIY